MYFQVCLIQHILSTQVSDTVPVVVWFSSLGVNIDQCLQQMLNTENLWLNVIITHSKFIASPYHTQETVFLYAVGVLQKINLTCLGGPIDMYKQTCGG